MQLFSPESWVCLASIPGQAVAFWLTEFLSLSLPASSAPYSLQECNFLPRTPSLQPPFWCFQASDFHNVSSACGKTKQFIISGFGLHLFTNLSHVFTYSRCLLFSFCFFSKRRRKPKDTGKYLELQVAENCRQNFNFSHCFPIAKDTQSNTPDSGFAMGGEQEGDGSENDTVILTGR